MRKLTGSLGVALASLGAATVMALTSTAPAIAANQALYLNGIAGGVPLGGIKSLILGGKFASYNNTEVPWPQQARPTTGQDSLSLTESVAAGVVNLDAAIKDALTKTGPGEHVTVVGLSAGALVADEELKRLLADPNAPDKSKLNFVVIADSSRATFNQNRLDKVLNYQYRLPVDTKYNTVVVVAEYDGFADFPDRVWNFVADANAYAGEILKHVPSMFTDLSTVGPSNITVTTNKLGGVTTKYFIPSDHLPLVELLPFLAPQEAQLRTIVDAGYVRNDAKSTAATSAAAVANAGANDNTSATVASPEAVAPASVVAEKAPEVSAPAETVTSKQTAPTDPAGTTTSAAASVESPQPTTHRGPAARGSDGSAVAHRSAANPARSAAASRAGKPSA